MKLTGDWCGARTALAEKGITIDLELLQIGQGNARGGKDTNRGFAYSGSMDYIVNFDFQKLGLWPGGFAKIRGETQFGQSINSKVGDISPVNVDAVLPPPADGGLTTLTEAYMIQFLSEKLFLLGGKVDLTRLPGQNVFASDLYTQFMNVSLWQNPVSFATVPYTTLMAGVGVLPAKWFDMTTLVLDSYGSPTRTGFDTALHAPDGTTVLQTFNFHTNFFELPGNHRFNVSWSDRDRVALSELDRLLLAGQVAPSFDRLILPRTFLFGGRRAISLRRFVFRSLLSRILEPGTQSEDCAFWYDFDQYLYTEPQDKTQGFGVFGRFGWSPGEVNPVETFYSLGLGGKGVVPGRDRDRFGIGYYLLNLSDDLPALLGVDAEQGVELFYNIEVTPWLHITPDLQVIVDPGGGFQNRQTAIVYGLRVQMSL